MNSAQSYNPTGDPTDPADAVCSIGTGPKLTTGSGDENNTFGNGTLVSPTQIVSAMHIFGGFADWSPGYHELPAIDDVNSRVARFRRKTDGTDIGGGLAVNYHQVRITGYLVPNIGGDIVIADLEEPVTHIAPVSCALDYLPLDVDDEITIVGWGLNGSSIGSGSRPGDARLIDKTISGVGDPNPQGAPNEPEFIRPSAPNPGANNFDSGGGVFKEVNGVWRLVAVISGSTKFFTLSPFKHDETFPLPGVYVGPYEEPVPPAFTQWVVPASDTQLVQSAADTGHGASTTLSVSFALSKEGDSASSIVELFSLESLPSTAFNLTGKLLLVTGNAVVDEQDIRVRRIKRTGVTDAATWNTYDGANAWETAGAKGETDDVYTADEIETVFPASAIGESVELLSGSEFDTMLANAWDDDKNLRLLIESLETLDDRVAIVRSLETAWAALRPLLVVRYKLPAVAPTGANLKNDGRTLEVLWEDGDFTGVTVPDIAHTATLDFTRDTVPMQVTASFQQVVTADETGLIVWYRTSAVVAETDTDLEVSGIPEGAYIGASHISGEVDEFSSDNGSGQPVPAAVEEQAAGAGRFGARTTAAAAIHAFQRSNPYRGFPRGRR